MGLYPKLVDFGYGFWVSYPNILDFGYETQTQNPNVSFFGCECMDTIIFDLTPSITKRGEVLWKKFLFSIFLNFFEHIVNSIFFYFTMIQQNFH